MTELFLLNTTFLNNDSVFTEHYNNLSEFRKKKVDSFVFRKDKNLSLGAGILLDKYLSKVGKREKDMLYSIEKFGKPEFENLKDLYFSLSHSGDYVAAAFSNNTIGCDIEKIRTVEPEVKLLCLSEIEISDGRYLTDAKKFCQLWCRKESYLKAKGLGLSVDIRTITDSTIEQEFAVFQSDIIDNYSLAVCHKNTSGNVNVRLIEL